MKITYIFPSRSRPEKFFNAINNILELSASDNYEIIAVLDVDDLSMNNEQIIPMLNQCDKITPYFGRSTGKINAINREIDKISENTSIVCLHSDDMVYIKKGFDLDIREAFENYSGMVHFPDQQTKDALMTYAMMSIDYLKIDGHIYDPRFESVYADNLQMELAKARGKYMFVNKQILEHRHPVWGFGVKDDLLIKTEDPIIYEKDRITYENIKKELCL